MTKTRFTPGGWKHLGSVTAKEVLDEASAVLKQARGEQVKS